MRTKEFLTSAKKFRGRILTYLTRPWHNNGTRVKYMLKCHTAGKLHEVLFKGATVSVYWFTALT
jgi:hypothetical protein